jgi:N-acetylglucosamine kinase-like BadF-type ATPase
MSRIYLGVDAGGTKTHYALHDETGAPIDFLAGGPGNHEYLEDGFDGVQRELTGGIGRLLARNGLALDDITYAALGVSGCDMAQQRTRLTDIVSYIGLKRFVLNNDAFLGIKAGTPHGYGLCSINGTGTIAAGSDVTGRQLQVGGLGFFSGDEAGGTHLGQMVFRKVYDEVYRLGPTTLLTPRFFGLMGIESAEELAPLWLNELMQPAGKAKVDALSRLLFDVAQEGDPVARELLIHTGEIMAHTAGGVVKALTWPDDEALTVVLVGSVHLKARCPLMRQRFEEALVRLTGRAYRFVPLQAAPVAGAVLWAMEEGGSREPDEAARERVLDSLNGK